MVDNCDRPNLDFMVNIHSNEFLNLSKMLKFVSWVLGTALTIGFEKSEIRLTKEITSNTHHVDVFD